MTRRQFVSAAIGMFCLAGLSMDQAHGQTAAAPGVTVSVTVDRTQYLLTGDPIKMAITLRNVSGGTVLASQGLTTEPLERLLTFVDPDGKPITAPQQTAPHEGPPPRVLPIDGISVQVDPLDVLAPTFVQTVTVPDAHTFYAFTKAGFYTVKATVPIRTYAAIFRSISGVDYAALEPATFAGVIESQAVRFALVADADHDGYAYPVPDSRISSFTVPDCNDANPAVNPGAKEILGNGIDDDCNPATPDTPPPPAPATIEVTAEQNNVGPGANPPVKKGPVANMPIHVFDAATGSCAARLGTKPDNFKSVWVSCVPKYLAATKADGTASFTVAPGSYLVLGEFDPNGVPSSGDEIYDGGTTGSLASGKTDKEKMKFIIKSNGKAAPGQTTQITGSLLTILQPLYVEWDGSQELYPFIFESDSAWTVTTSISPPPGFVADNRNLTSTVNTTLTAAQFTITDFGSSWVPTGVSHRVVHNGKPQTVTSQIGVLLSARLAQAKGLTRRGLTLPPGLAGQGPPGLAGQGPPGLGGQLPPGLGGTQP